MTTEQRYAAYAVRIPNGRLLEFADQLSGAMVLLDQVDEQNRLISGELVALEQLDETRILLTLRRRIRPRHRPGQVDVVLDGRVVSIAPAVGSFPEFRTHVELPWPVADQILKSLGVPVVEESA